MRVRAGRRDSPAQDSPWQVAPLPTPGHHDQFDQIDQTDQAAETEAGGPPVTPSAAVPLGQLTPRVVLAPVSVDAPLTWVGAHGGAGETSIARASGTGLALTQRWPDPELGWPAPCVIVARSNAAGLDAAARMIQEVLSATVPDLILFGLFLVADAPGRPPKSIRTRLHELSGAVPAAVTVPWIPAWRETPYTPQPAVTALVEHVTARINAHTTAATDPTAAPGGPDSGTGGTPPAVHQPENQQ